MLQTTQIGSEYVMTYSDSGMLLLGGVPLGYYASAIDKIADGVSYTETDTPVPTTDSDEMHTGFGQGEAQ